MIPTPPVPYEPPVDPVTGKPINAIKALTPYRPKKPRDDKYIPTERERHAVAELASLAFTREQIARVLNMSVTLLDRTFEDEMFLGRAEKLASVSQTMFAIATDPSNKGAVSAGKYILATQGGPQWRETKVSELVGADGRPIPVGATRTVDPSLLSDEGYPDQRVETGGTECGTVDRSGDRGTDGMSHAVVVQSAERLGAERERAAIVAWLEAQKREYGARVGHTLSAGGREYDIGRVTGYARAASCIERGDHLR